MRDAANTFAVFVWGPDRIKLEYVEHKPEFLARLIEPRHDLVVAGAGMARTVPPPRRPRSAAPA